jgi:hypothetical protein
MLVSIPSIILEKRVAPGLSMPLSFSSSTVHLEPAFQAKHPENARTLRYLKLGSRCETEKHNPWEG